MVSGGLTVITAIWVVLLLNLLEGCAPSGPGARPFASPDSRHESRTNLEATLLARAVGEAVRAGASHSETRIIGGTAVQNKNLMFVVRLSPIRGYTSVCTGVLVASRWVLTAAHCFLPPSTDVISDASSENTQVTIGCSLIGDASCLTVAAKRVVLHPCFEANQNEDHDDIALVELESSAPPHIPRAPVSGLSSTLQSAEDGEPLTLAGYGVVSPASRETSRQLMELQGYRTTKENCTRANPYTFQRGIMNINHTLCTGADAGTDSCSGDSGGPALKEEAGMLWVVGILSRGSELPSSGGCAASGRLGMYIEIRHYADFIFSTVSGRSFACESCPCVCNASSCPPRGFDFEPAARAEQEQSTNVHKETAQATPPRNPRLAWIPVVVGCCAGGLVALVLFQIWRMRLCAGSKGQVPLEMYRRLSSVLESPRKGIFSRRPPSSEQRSPARLARIHAGTEARASPNPTAKKLHFGDSGTGVSQPQHSAGPAPLLFAGVPDHGGGGTRLAWSEPNSGPKTAGAIRLSMDERGSHSVAHASQGSRDAESGVGREAPGQRVWLASAGWGGGPGTRERAPHASTTSHRPEIVRLPGSPTPTPQHPHPPLSQGWPAHVGVTVPRASAAPAAASPRTHAAAPATPAPARSAATGADHGLGRAMSSGWGGSPAKDRGSILFLEPSEQGSAAASGDPGP